MAELSDEPIENYLKQIYHLSLDRVPVKTSRLAGALGLSPAAVTEMLKRLDHQKLVAYRPYRGVALTGRGRRRALAIMRRHRLWEVFLHRILAVPFSEVHQHAERLEHATDDRLAAHLDEFLGNPAVDPHGHPIPTAGGEIAEVDRQLLLGLAEGSSATITQCRDDQDGALLDYLGELGLLPGAAIVVCEVAPFNGPITLEVEGKRCAIGVDIARALFVRSASE